MFEKYKVLSRTELISRHDIYTEQYEKAIKIEGEVALSMARTMIVPAAVRYQDELASVVKSSSGLGIKNPRTLALLKKVCSLSEDILGGIMKLEKALLGDQSADVIREMNSLRESADELEAVIPENIWPLPSYAEMLFLL
jgi:glutamine synthetase